MESSALSYIRVKFIDGKQSSSSKTILLTKYISIDEIKELIKGAFDYSEGVKITGLVDVSKNETIYPFSIFAHQLSSFHDRCLHLLISSNEAAQESDATKLNPSLYNERMAEAAFYFLDINGDNRVDRLEMISALSNSLRYLDRDDMFGYDGDIDQLASMITESCFTFLGLEESLFASLHDFTAWYLSVGDTKYREILIKSIESYHSYLSSKSPAKVNRFAFNDDGNSERSALSQLLAAIANINDTIGLEHVSVNAIADSLRADAQVIQVPHHEVDAKYHKIISITRSHFMKRLESLSSVTSKFHEHQNQYDVNKLLLMIFNAFHPMGPYDSVPLSSIMSGLSIFYHDKDSQEDSLRQLFLIVADIRHDKIFASDRILRDFIYQSMKLFYLLSPPLRACTLTDAESFTIFVYGRVLKCVDREYFGLWNSTEFMEAASFAIELIYSFLNGDPRAREGYVPLQLLSSNGQPISADVAELQGFDVISSQILDHEHVVVSLIDAKIVLGLVLSTPITIFQLFKTQAVDNDGNISLTSYHHVMHKLLRHHYSSLSIVDRIVVDYIIERIFDLFNHNSDENDLEIDPSHEKKCDVLDITLALISLCGGEPKEKASCVLEVFRYFGDDAQIDDEIKDLADDSPISMEYVAMCTEPLFVTIGGLNPKLNDREVIGDMSYELTTYAFQTLFKKASSDEHEMSTDQFDDWFEVLFKFFDRDHGQAALEAALVETQTLSEEEITFNELKSALKHIYSESSNAIVDDEDQNDLKLDFESTGQSALDLGGSAVLSGTLPPATASIVAELKSCGELLGLAGFSADDILDTLGEYCEDGQISLQAWNTALSYIMRLSNIAGDKYEDASSFANQLFDAFRVDSNVDTDTVSYVQFTSGLAILSSSSMEEKLTVCFVLHSMGNSEGIGFSEFESIVGSSLSVLSICSKLAASKIIESGHSIDDFATAVVSECYAALNLEKDKKLSLEQLCEVGNDCLVLAENIAM
jgi:hypothetical protein